MRGIVIGLLGLGALYLSSCGDRQSQALSALKDRGYALDVGNYFRAAAKGDLPALAFFQEAGMALDVRDSNGESALVEAIRGGQAKAVTYLLDHGVTLDSQAIGLDEMLKLAIHSRSEATVKLLLGQGIELSTFARKEVGCLQLAAGIGAHSIVSLLLPHCPEEKDQALIAASASGDVPTLDVLLQADASVFYREPDTGNTALHRAALGGHADAVEFLHRSGANRLALNSAGFSAFQLASQGGHADVVSVLSSKPTSDELESAGKVRVELMDNALIDLRSRILWQGRSLGELMSLRSVRERRAPFSLDAVNGLSASFTLRGDRIGPHQAGAGDQFEGFVVEKVIDVPTDAAKPRWWEPGVIVRSRNSGHQVLAVPGVTVRTGELCGVIELNGDDVLYEAQVGDKFKCLSDTDVSYQVVMVTPTSIRLVAENGGGEDIFLRTGSNLVR